ncbi:MAG: hypothetical protein QG646_990 [Euryarchaeota archaeon]|nr:hypothetical protein [Euryarchaeota archaeon]
MGRQTFDRIKKTVSVLLAVLFVVSLTASACSACTDTATTPTTATSDTNSNTLSPSDLGTLLASLLNNMGYKLDTSNSESNTGSGDYSDLSNFFNNVDTSGVTV